MKKLTITILWLLFLIPAYSQNIGIKASYVVSNWEGLIYTSDMQTNTLNGFSIGVYGHAPLSPIIVFEPGIFITPKGTRLFDGPFPEAISNKALYLDVPILMKMYIGGGGFHVDVGPQVSYLLSHKLVLDSGQETDALENFNRWDFSVNFGLAYDLPIGMTLGASFDLGFYNIIYADFLDWTEVHNRVLRFSVGYTFN